MNIASLVGRKATLTTEKLVIKGLSDASASGDSEWVEDVCVARTMYSCEAGECGSSTYDMCLSMEWVRKMKKDGKKVERGIQR